MNSTIADALGRTLIVGGGSMGQAICAGLLEIEGMTPEKITVANPGAEKRALIDKAYRVATVADAVEALPADTIILAVKPAKVAAVAQSLAQAGIAGVRVISIAAGVCLADLSAALGEDIPVARVMPNTPLLVGCGMSAVSVKPDAPAELAQLVCDVFASMGHAVIVDEPLQDAVTAVSGSGPAYFELVVQQLAKGGEQLGLPADVALELALQTMRGTAVLLDETKVDPADAIEAVSSPGGTTVAALQAMRAGGIEEALIEGVHAAAARSVELGNK